MNTNNETEIPARPIGYWITAVDRLTAAAFAQAFSDEGATRRDWRILNTIDGSVSSVNKLSQKSLVRLIERGWVEEEAEGWALTEEGSVAKNRLSARVEAIRKRVTDAVNPEDFEVTERTLELLAREFGWDEEVGIPKRRGHFRREHGPSEGSRRDLWQRGMERRNHMRRVMRAHLGDEACAESQHTQDRIGDNYDGHPMRGASHPMRGERHPHRRHHHGARAYERGFAEGYARGAQAA